MAEEVRFFLRTALYSAAIAVVYWFNSSSPVHGYDWAGTVMLLFTALAAGGVVAVLAGSVRQTRAPAGGRSMLSRVTGIIALTDPPGAAGDRPLSTELERVPVGSAWPVAAGLAATLIGLGLVFGPWLWLPGLALLAATVWGWVTE